MKGKRKGHTTADHVCGLDTKGLTATGVSRSVCSCGGGGGGGRPGGGCST